MNLIYNTLFLLFLTATAFGATEKLETTTHDLFGSKLSISASKTIRDSIDKEIKEKSTFFSGAYDPDCYYKQNKQCGKAQLEKSELDLLAEIEKETDGHFSLSVKTEGVSKRDFGGVAQGAVLERFAKQFPKGWVGNFSGDIYIAPESTLPNFVTINDASLPDIPFAGVDIKSGWISSATSPHFGGNVHTTKKTYDFQKIFLFAKPEFSGTRIDAWDNALIEGGLPLLRKLIAKTAYKNQWAYLYFDKDSKPFCSPLLECQLEDAENRIVRVIWK